MRQIAFRCVRLRVGATQVVTVARRRQQSPVAVLARGDLLAAIYARLALLHSDGFDRLALRSVRTYFNGPKLDYLLILHSTLLPHKKLTRNSASSARTANCKCCHHRRTPIAPAHSCSPSDNPPWRWRSRRCRQCAPATCRTRSAPRTHACHSSMRASCRRSRTNVRPNRMSVVRRASTTRGTCACSGNACDWCEPTRNYVQAIRTHSSALKCHTIIIFSLTTPWPHVSSFISHVELYTLPSEAHVGPSFGALLQSTGHDSRIALVLLHGPTCASATAAVPTRHACTRSMQRFRYVRPSVPQTGSFSVGQRCIHAEPPARSQPFESSWRTYTHGEWRNRGISESDCVFDCVLYRHTADLETVVCGLFAPICSCVCWDYLEFVDLAPSVNVAFECTNIGPQFKLYNVRKKCIKQPDI